MRCLLIFWDPPDARWQWALKPGFRHVFCAVDDGRYWVTFDARDGRTAVEVVQASDYDLAGFYRRQDGFTVAETVRGGPLQTPLVVANCVGLVKAVCSIRAPLAATPYALYRHVTRTAP